MKKQTIENEVLIKGEVLKSIERELEQLSSSDVDSFHWWMKFKEWIQKIPESPNVFTYSEKDERDIQNLISNPPNSLT